MHKILIISGGMPTSNAPKMLLDMQKSLSKDYEVDLLLKYPYGDNQNIISVFNKFEYRKEIFVNMAKSFVFKFLKKFKKSKVENLPYYFFDLNEGSPKVESKKVINKIIKKYDLVIIFFWQHLITSKTIGEIYNKLGSPIFLIAADMLPITGGCSYFWNCQNLKNSCGNCPGLKSNLEFDITRKNILFKRNIFNQINIVFLSNSWVNKYALESNLFKNVNTIYPIIDENVFKNLNKDTLKNKYGYEGRTILMFGSNDLFEKRKGYVFLKEALLQLKNNKPHLLDNLLLLIVGEKRQLIGLESFSLVQLGHVDFERLAEYYSMSDVYLSPTIQDGGPMMLNQALMCGTPAVAFDIGVATDIITENTGYLAKLHDSRDFYNGIVKLLELDEHNRKVMQNNCRNLMLNLSSYGAFLDRITQYYNLYKNISN